MDNELQASYTTEQTYHSIRHSIVSAQRSLSVAVNSAMVTAYWEIGEQIYKACGENDRAGYGKKLLQYLSAHLTAEFGKGFDESNLRKMRQFYCAYPIRDTLCPELSWSHYRLLMRVPDEKERAFYAEECAKSAWSVRQLERQIHTMYYQRILASQDKSLVAAEIQTTEPKPEYEKIIKDPYVMEFLQIQPDTHVYEGELEQALIDHLQHFLLELGRGFSFVARQKKFTLDGQNFFIDLVFYNYILKCFVLIDLKMGQLTHQDLGQMQMYVNYYTRELMNEGDTPPIGIVLCADKSDAVVKYTLPEDADEYGIFSGHTWHEFSDAIKTKNRFCSGLFRADQLASFLGYSITKYTKGTELFRARISDDIEGYPKEEMGQPPTRKRKSGRVNPEGIGVLYLTSDEATALREVRASAFDFVTIGIFELLKDIKVVNISGLNSISPAVYSSSIESLAANIRAFSDIAREIAKPLRRNDSSLEYLPTQFITEFIKSKGYAGVSYTSTMGTGGTNIAVFDESLFECKSVHVVEISSIEYSYSKVK